MSRERSKILQMVADGTITPQEGEALLERIDSSSTGTATLEPEVTIIQRDDEFIREYRVNGVLRAIRVEPAVGVPYFLIDVDGDGKLDRRVRRLEPDFMIPHWVLFSW